MSTIVTRAGKGSALTWTEADANFTNLNTDKADKASPTFTGTVVLPATTSIGDASATEIAYLDGVTSAIQTQMNLKAPLANPTFTGTLVMAAPFTLGATSVTATGTELNYTDVTTLGTQQASKCVTTDANSNSGIHKMTQLHIGTSGSETQVTATAAELNYNDLATLGTLAASKVWSSDSSLNTIMPTAGTLTVQSGGEIILETGSAFYNQAEVYRTVLSAEHGAGAIGTSSFGAPKTYRWTESGVRVTQIKIDLTGLKSKDAANDAIGLGAGGASYIGRYVVATMGILFKAELSCLETPAGGDNDINVVSNASAVLEYDSAAGTAYVAGNVGDSAVGQTFVSLAPVAAANDYLYLAAGTGDLDAVYTAGMYILTLYGHDVLV